MGMKNVIKFLCNFALCFVAIDAFAREIAPDEVVGDIDIGSDTSDLTIINHGTINGTISIANGVSVTIQNYGVINGAVNCTTCALVDQIITGNGDMNLIAGLSGHRVIVDNENNNINLSDVIAAAGGSGKIVLTGANVVLDIGVIDTHPAIEFNPGAGGNSTNSVAFIIRGWNENWDESQPILNGIVLSNASDNFGGAEFIGVDSMFDPYAELDGSRLYARFARQTNYGIVFENDLGDWLDELRDENPDDKLLVVKLLD